MYQSEGLRSAVRSAVVSVSSDSSLRREKLLAEIQQDFPAVGLDAEEGE